MITHSEVGRQVIEKFIEAIGTHATVESRPKMDGRSMIAMLSPNNPL